MSTNGFRTHPKPGWSGLNPSTRNFTLILVSLMLLSVLFQMNVQEASGTAPSFLLSAIPNTLAFSPGSIRISTINVTALDGFTGPIDLSVIPPTGITASLAPTTLSIQSSSPTSTSALTVSASSSVTLGTYRLTVVGSSQAGSQYATVTAIIVANTPLACGSFGTCFILSDSGISNPTYSGGTIHFTATGPSGTSGFANVTIPRTITSNVTNTRVSINDALLSSHNIAITSNGVDYFISFTFTFQNPVSVDVLLYQLSQPDKIFGISPVIFYEGAAGVAITIIGVVAILAIRRKKR